MDGWKTIFLLGLPIFSGYVSFREGNWAESFQLGNGWVTDASLPTQWMPHYREGPLPRFTRKLCLYPRCSLAADVTEWLDTRPNSLITMSGCSSKVLCVWLLPGDICIHSVSLSILCLNSRVGSHIESWPDDPFVELVILSQSPRFRDWWLSTIQQEPGALIDTGANPCDKNRFCDQRFEANCSALCCINIINIICPRLFRYNWQLDPKRDFDSWSSHDTCSRLHELPPCICKSKACSTTAKENTWRQNTRTMQGRHFANNTESHPIQVISKWNIHHHWFVASLTMKSSCSYVKWHAWQPRTISRTRLILLYLESWLQPSHAHSSNVERLHVMWCDTPSKVDQYMNP